MTALGLITSAADNGDAGLAGFSNMISTPGLTLRAARSGSEPVTDAVDEIVCGLTDSFISERDRRLNHNTTTVGARKKIMIIKIAKATQVYTSSLLMSVFVGLSAVH